jgi:hypothetical protein
MQVDMMIDDLLLIAPSTRKRLALPVPANLVEKDDDVDG